MICRLLTVFDTVISRGGGIRTPGTLRFNGFQDRRIRPLCHSSILQNHSYNQIFSWMTILGLQMYRIIRF